VEGIHLLTSLGEQEGALRLGHGTFKESNGGVVIGVVLTYEVEWRASSYITEQGVRTMAEEKVDDASSESSGAIEVTHGMESRTTPHPPRRHLCINAGNNSFVL
jgi:hypothetical protein